MITHLKFGVDRVQAADQVLEEEFERLRETEKVLARRGGLGRAQERGDPRAAIFDDATLVGRYVRRLLARAVAVATVVWRRVEWRIGRECRMAVLARRAEIIRLRVVRVVVGTRRVGRRAAVVWLLLRVQALMRRAGHGEHRRRLRLRRVGSVGDGSVVERVGLITGRALL